MLSVVFVQLLREGFVAFPAAMYARNATIQTPPGVWDEGEREGQRLSAFPS
jgi:hypothetical protein